MRAKNKFTFFGLLALVSLLNSCHFPAYRSMAQTSLYDLNFSEGKWFLNHVSVNGKPVETFSNLTEEELKPCLNDSLYLNYGIRKSAYNIPIITSKNSSENLSLLKATKSIDYVIQVTGSVGDNEIGSINFKPIKNSARTNALMKIEVFDVNNGKLIYAHTTSGEVIIENFDEDILFGKSAQTILKKCLKKELTQFKKSGGCKY